MVDRASIFAAPDLVTREVLVPEWGGSVFVRTLDGRARDELDTFVAQRRATNDLRGFRVKVVILSTCDDKGARIFTDADAEALNCKSSVVMQRIEQAACALNGIGGESMEQAGADFPPTPPASSGSA